MLNPIGVGSLLLVLLTGLASTRASESLDAKLYHLRAMEPREWSEFPATPEAKELTVTFRGTSNEAEWALELRQQDVKQRWDVLLNDKPLGRLVVNENDMVIYFPIPSRSVVDGENRIQVRQQLTRRSTADDVRVGEVVLHHRPLREVLRQARLEVEVRDVDTGKQLPSRITIVNEDGALQTTGAPSSDTLAVRPGIVYTSTGDAAIDLPPGRYRIYAGRGFEYSLAQSTVTLAPGQTVKQQLKIKREVPTAGYVACDTHVHTFTFSRHGDASIEERMITLAGEGIELPIATDHNLQIDYEEVADRLGVRSYFTPMIGNEVTTRTGHFNIFPVSRGAPVPKHDLREWDGILDEIYRTAGVKVAILNHARDLHSGFRPFGSEHFNDVVGERRDGWPVRFNAMEVINSGATQTDHLRLFQDWMALLNRGFAITPVGSSDSHDVARHFVGQGRTYIRADDRDVSRIDVDQAVENFIQGRVMVSYGLLAELTVEGKYASGELAHVAGDQLHIAVRVLGPSWVNATEIRLYANGRVIRTERIAGDSNSLREGVQWQGEWILDRPRNDVHLVAIALGTGIDFPYWKTAKPYQATSPDWEAKTIGCSGAVRIDCDGDGRFKSAHDYAVDAFAAAGGDLTKFVTLLSSYDQAVAAQAALVVEKSGHSWSQKETRDVLEQAAEHVKAGVAEYLRANVRVIPELPRR